MPLLCISLLALLLLPQSLSCNSERRAEDVRNDYLAIVKTDLDNTRGSITALLNKTCKHQSRMRCLKADFTNVMDTMHNLTCRMKDSNLSQTESLVSSVLNSIRCSCPYPKRTPKNSSVKPVRQKILCRANSTLSALTTCYEMLNSIEGQRRPD